MPEAQTLPSAQSKLVVRSERVLQSVSPLAQKPVPSVMLKQKHELLGPQVAREEQVVPAQALTTQAPLMQTLDEHLRVGRERVS